MKITKLFFMSIVMLVGLTNCKKDSNVPEKNYVEAIKGSFIPKDVNIAIKKDVNPFVAPEIVTHTWTMYAVNSPFYNHVPFGLINGSEFVTNSAAQIWWSTPGNNPITFPANIPVYSNLTPAEPVRLIMETKNASNVITYLGIVDFNPTQTQFPLTIDGKRLGDVLAINTDALTSLPGGSNLTITVKFNLYPVDMTATEYGTLSTASSGIATGVTGVLNFCDIKYGTTPDNIIANAGSGNFILYNGVNKKVFDNIEITIFEAASSSTSANTFVVTVPASKVGIAGKGSLLKVTTTKVGWYDSQTANSSDTDITVEVVEVPIN
jgi:hypothetical protein